MHVHADPRRRGGNRTDVSCRDPDVDVLPLAGPGIARSCGKPVSGAVLAIAGQVHILAAGIRRDRDLGRLGGSGRGSEGNFKTADGGRQDRPEAVTGTVELIAVGVGTGK